MGKEKIIPLNIWTNIERVGVERMDVVYEGKTIVGIHHWLDEDDNAILELERVIKKLTQYKKELEVIYGFSKPAHRSRISTYVYLMKCNNTGLHKIGRSINPSSRERTILSQSSSITIVFISPITSITTEKILHKRFSRKRIRGEWFDLNTEDISIIKNYNYSNE